MREMTSSHPLAHICAVSLAFTLATLSNGEASAFAGRETQVPNNQWRCAICHQNQSGGGPRTPFGEDIKNFGTEGGSVSWIGVCDRDSDGDGFTNGQELGDPDCTWMLNDPDPDAFVSDPNDPMSFPEEMNMPSPPTGDEMPTDEPAAGEETPTDLDTEEPSTTTGDEMTEENAEEGGCQTGTRSGGAMGLMFMCLAIFLTMKRRLA